jgi:hypothetical protein
LEHGKASIETVGDIDLCARKRDTDATVGRQANVMDDEPQLTSVGCRYRMRLTWTVTAIRPMVAAKLATLRKRDLVRNTACRRIKAYGATKLEFSIECDV